MKKSFEKKVICVFIVGDIEIWVGARGVVLEGKVIEGGVIDGFFFFYVDWWLV